jgi:diguanylate cyclase (GGDEF)-like protein
VRLDRGEIQIRGSFGVAVCTDEHPQDLPTLLRNADEALYRAKEHGRNRMELAVPCPSALQSLDTAAAPLNTGSR